MVIQTMPSKQNSSEAINQGKSYCSRIFTNPIQSWSKGSCNDFILATGQQAAGISNNSIITNISASVGQSQIGYLPQVVSDVVKYTDWIMFSKFPKETISVAWSQRVTANEPEKEIEAIYYVVDCWYSPNSQFEGIQGI